MKRHAFVTACLALMALGAVGTTTSNYLFHEHVLTRMELSAALTQRERTKMSTKWISGGEEQVLTTPQNDDESVEDWGKRHKARVIKMKIIFPEDV